MIAEKRKLFFSFLRETGAVLHLLCVYTLKGLTFRAVFRTDVLFPSLAFLRHHTHVVAH